MTLAEAINAEIKDIERHLKNAEASVQLAKTDIAAAKAGYADRLMEDCPNHMTDVLTAAQNVIECIVMLNGIHKGLWIAKAESKKAP